MAESLDAFMAELEGTQPAPFFAPEVRYGQKEDALFFYFRNEPSYAHRLNALITIFLAFDTHKLVGCQVKGLKRKLETDGHLRVTIRRAAKIQLGLFFHWLAFDMADPEPRGQLVELGQRAKGLEVDAGELCLVE